MTLRSKLFLPLTLLSGLFFLFLYGYWFPQSLRNLEQQELRATAQHLNSVAEGLIPLLLAHQLDTVHENLDTQLRLNKEWVSIRLTDPDNRLLYPIQETPAALSKDFRLVEQRLQFLGNDLGNLSLTINIASTTAAAEARYRQLATALLLVFCGYLISITVIVERIVRRPVNRLADAAQKMAQGDFEAALVTSGNDEVGTLVNSFAGMRDAIRKYQASLLTSNQAISRLSRAVEQSPVSIMITDTEGRLTFVNPKFSQVTGYSSEEALGKNPRILKSGTTNAAEYETLWQTISTGGIWYGEFCNKRKNGERYWESATISPILDNDGAIISYLAVKEDITARKATEESLQKTARDLNEAQRIGHLGSWELNLLTNQLTWSDEIYRIFGIDPGAFDASYEAFLQAIHPDDREAVNAAYLNSVKTRTPYSIDHRLLLPDGRIRYVHEECETFYEDDQPVRSAGTVQDITGQKLVEERLRSISEELEQRVSERTAELEAKNRELERINRLFVGRELRMVELKEQIKELEKMSA